MPSAGAYVRYPIEDLIGILALESHRHGCLVVGEDLGTVPDGFRERMAEANILSYRVLFFEREPETALSCPERLPTPALAIVGSHDLPTLRGWWEGRGSRSEGTARPVPGAGRSLAPAKMRERDPDAASGGAPPREAVV